jgi:hypothetical protein
MAEEGKGLTVGELLAQQRKAKAANEQAELRAAKPRDLGELEIVYVAPSELVPWADNPRSNDKAAAKLAEEIRSKGFRVPIVATRDGTVRAGHTRLKAALILGLTLVPVMYQDFENEEEAQAFSLADNRLGEEAKWDKVKLGQILERWEHEHGMAAVERMTGFTQGEIGGLTGSADPVRKGGLAQDFGVPPFSVLDGRQGYWRDRKKAWLGLGIMSELGRAEVQESLGSARTVQTGGADVETWVTTSIFDPVLCELVYRWFCPPGGVVLDPFAGGSVRGVVAACLGLQYVGVDLSQRQVAANREQLLEVKRRWQGEQ